MYQISRTPIPDFILGGKDDVNTPQEVGLLEFLIPNDDRCLIRVQ